MNRFIKESDVEEAKKKRAEEWEAARAAGRELPDPDEPLDTRSLFERLKEQKDKKQDAFEDQLKFKNMIYKGLNSEDADFLGMVSQKQAEIDERRFNQESEELVNFRAAVDERVSESLDDKTSSDEKLKTIKVAEDFKKRKSTSQAALIGAAIVKKKKVAKVEVVENVEQQLDETKSKASEQSNGAQVTGSSLLSLADYPSSSSDEDAND